MGFFSRIKRFFGLSPSDPKAWDPKLWNLRTYSDSGEQVDESTALTYSAFWNAVNLIAGTISSLPLHLMRPLDEKGAEKFREYGLYDVMARKWNDLMTAKTGRMTITAHVLTWGNGYAEIVRDRLGNVLELWPIPPNKVISINLVDGDLVYEIKVDSETVFLPRKKILHLHGLGFDGVVGYSVVEMARKSLGLSMSMETFGGRFFSHGTNPSAILKHPNKVSDIKAMREAMADVYTGLGNTHRLMLLEEGMDFVQVGIKPEESQFLESRNFQIPEIARWFNLPPHKLKDLTKSSFNNIEQEQLSYVVDSILPWIIDFEQEYNRQLLSDSQAKQQGLFFKHNFEGLLRADSKSRAEYYQIMRRNGFMTINEVREKENMNPHEDPMADELWTEVNLAPLSKYDEITVSEESQNTPDQQQNLIEFNINGQKLIGGHDARITENIGKAKAK